MRHSKKRQVKKCPFKEIRTGRLIKGRLVMGVNQEKKIVKTIVLIL